MADTTPRPKGRRSVRARPLDEPAPATRAVVGIDPGRKGVAVALSMGDPGARLLRPPQIDCGSWSLSDLRPLVALLRGTRVVCFVERVQGRGGWGATGNFNFGCAAGAVTIQAIMAGWDVRLIDPTAWQRLMHTPMEATPKERSGEAYGRLFPHDPLPRSKAGRLDDNAVDALLIAAAGVLTLGGVLRAWRFPEGSPCVKNRRS